MNWGIRELENWGIGEISQYFKLRHEDILMLKIMR